jgi:DNA-binding transcriptional MocR family regulator
MIQWPKLDPDASVPLYRQLSDFIRDQIASGSFRTGDRLPATRELAVLVGLNRTTIAAAYEILETEGLIHGHVGRGSFVAGAAAPDRISFASSRPAEELFPLDEFRRTAKEVLDDPRLGQVLQLGSPNGYGPLRRWLLDRAAAEGVARSGDDVLITSGAQQALDLIQRVFAPAGETVIVEDPVYPGLKNVFEQGGARLVGLPVGDSGVAVNALDRALRTERPRLVVLTPNFQNPTGATLDAPSRRNLLRLVRAAGALLVEIDIYRELRYSGEPQPSLKSLDAEGETIQIGSFSKIAFPGLRVGWVVAPRAVLARLAEAKQSSDLHTDQLSQAILLRFAESGRLDHHRRRVLAAGAERLQAALSACEELLPPGSHFTRPRGGMSLWVNLPAACDAAELLPAAERAGVTYLPGRFFTISHPQPNGLRLSFAGLPPERICLGIERLAEVARRAPRAAGDWEPTPAMV